jgi:sugar phosphate isomerase/epimerase
MKNAGLRLVSTHLGFADLKSHMDDVLEFSHQLGLQYIICPSPQLRNPPPPRPRPTAAQIAAMRAARGSQAARGGRGNGFRPPAFTLDDWKYNAEQFNIFGEKINAAGMRFGYHNHTTEFTKVDGQVPLEVLIQNTDPDKVHFEMDCGWVVVGGGDPVSLMRRYKNRFVMIHVKDFKPAAAGATGRARMPSATELGRGEIDYAPIFAEARRIGIQHCFVEQEGFDIPWQQSLEADVAYLRKLGY